MRRSFLRPAAAITPGFVLLLFCTHAQAGLIVIGDPQHDKNGFSATLGWDPEEKSSVDKNLTEWDFSVSIDTQKNQASGQWIARHLVKADDKDTGPAPVIPKTPYSFPTNKLGPVVNQFLVTRHDPHRDAYQFLFERSGNSKDNKITLKGKHEGDTLPVKWSFTPDKPGSFFVSAAYANGTITRIFGPQKVTAQDVDKKKKFEGVIPRSGTFVPTAYGIGFTDPGTVDTLLGFVSGTEGDFSLADLELAVDFFKGSDEFIVPTLFNASEDLFVAVDLTQWLTFPTSFVDGQTFEFIDGRSDQLPGFLLARANTDGTSPIVFDPTAGFSVADDLRFSGLVNVIGTIDGQEAVPGPATLALIACGFAMVGLCRRRKCPAPARLDTAPPRLRTVRPPDGPRPARDRDVRGRHRRLRSDYFRRCRLHATPANPASPELSSRSVAASGTRKPRISPPGKRVVWIFR